MRLRPNLANGRDSTIRLEPDLVNRRDPINRLGSKFANRCDQTGCLGSDPLNRLNPTHLGHGPDLSPAELDPSPAEPTYPFDPFSLSLHYIQNRSTLPIPVTSLSPPKPSLPLASNHSGLDLLILESLKPLSQSSQPEYLTHISPTLSLSCAHLFQLRWNRPYTGLFLLRRTIRLERSPSGVSDFLFLQPNPNPNFFILCLAPGQVEGSVWDTTGTLLLLAQVDHELLISQGMGPRYSFFPYHTSFKASTCFSSAGALFFSPGTLVFTTGTFLFSTGSIFFSAGTLFFSPGSSAKASSFPYHRP